MCVSENSEESEISKIMMKLINIILLGLDLGCFYIFKLNLEYF